MRIISKSTKIIGVIFTFFIIFILSIGLALSRGIDIDELTFGNINLKQLYIKLDKKIILKADKIAISLQNDENFNDNSAKEFLKLSNYMYFIDKIFHEILIKDLQIANNNIQILYKNNKIFINSEYFLADLNIEDELDNKTDLITINKMQFKDFAVNLQGKLSTNLKDKKFAFSGSFDSYELNGKIDFVLKKEIIKYKIYDVSAYSLGHFMVGLDEKIGLNKEIKNWIYGYIVADEYHVNEINGKINLKTNDFFLKDLNASAQAKNLEVMLDKSLQPIKVEDANITLANETLNFKLHNPTYVNKKLDGSSLYIRDIFALDENPGININIITNSIYDKHINAILKAYGIDVPITQTAGEMNARLNLDIDFNTLNVIANGKFTTKNAKLKIANADFKSKNAEILLNNTNEMIINALDFGMDFFNSDANAIFDLKNKKATIKGVLKSFNLNTQKLGILNLNSQNFNSTLDFSGDDTVLDFHTLDLSLVFGKKNQITMHNPTRFVPNSELLSSLNISAADKISINTDDFNEYEIFAQNIIFNLPLQSKNGKKYEKDSFYIKVKDDKISGTSTSEKIKFSTKNNDVKIDVKDIDITVNLDQDSNNENGEFIARATNSNIIFTDINRTLKLPNYEVLIAPKQIKFGSNTDGGRINFSKIDKHINLEVRDISGEYINQFLNKQSFSGGKFKAKVVGLVDSFKGEVRFYDTYFTDYTFYQKLLSFIDSIPTLLSLKTPDFNSNGFTAKNGKILFEKNKNVLKFIAIKISGSSADILGSGEIDIKTGEININLELEFLKEASGIISNIPLINQIILGKDRTFSTLIKIRGTMSEPKYETQVLQDTLLAPFKIIRNVLQVPFLIFD
ncbi:AsmA-like C-terminal domain-containing protein [Campylobacter majalis]|uniref:YhdP family protein n=1 Tax=Campylobacter majalis TaxID=2790656 RepID=UPI003D69C03E